MTARVTYVNGSVLNASDLTNGFLYLPYAMQSDIKTGVTGSVRINFDTGRFSVAPIVFLTVVSGNNTATSATISAVTSTYVDILVWTGTTASTTAKSIHWTAIQMTGSTAAG
jgi:hypothetical protein